MRFGKKLALIVSQDERDGRGYRPYISHKVLKLCLTETIREVKEFGESAKTDAYKMQLRNVMRDDLQRIKTYLIVELESLTTSVSDLVIEGESLGVSEKRSLLSLIEAYKKVRQTKKV